MQAAGSRRGALWQGAQQSKRRILLSDAMLPLLGSSRAELTVVPAASGVPQAHLTLMPTLNPNEPIYQQYNRRDKTQGSVREEHPFPPRPPPAGNQQLVPHKAGNGQGPPTPAFLITSPSVVASMRSARLWRSKRHILIAANPPQRPELGFRVLCSLCRIPISSASGSHVDPISRPSVQ